LRGLSCCEVRFEVAACQKRHDKRFILGMHSEIAESRSDKLLSLAIAAPRAYLSGRQRFARNAAIAWRAVLGTGVSTAARA